MKLFSTSTCCLTPCHCLGSPQTSCASAVTRSKRTFCQAGHRKPLVDLGSHSLHGHLGEQSSLRRELSRTDYSSSARFQEAFELRRKWLWPDLMVRPKKEKR